MDRPQGMQEHEFQAYIAGMMEAGLDPDRVVQVVGDAPASAGFHLPDGTFTNSDGEQEQFTAALDLSVKHPGARLTTAQIHKMLDCLSKRGFIGWYRPWGSSEHCHMVYCGLPMKAQLRRQVHDWFQHRDGLADHGFSDFVMPTQAEMNYCRALFLAHNPPSG